jgi:hypothetical protein
VVISLPQADQVRLLAVISVVPQTISSTEGRTCGPLPQYVIVTGAGTRAGPAA